MLTKEISQEYIKILKEELVPAMGCTEPIALAFGGAKAREILGTIPDSVVARCSGNMIKNVRCVTIPNSDYLVGIEAGVTLGIVAGNAEKKMEVLKDVTKEDIQMTKKLLQNDFCKVELLETSIPLHIQLELKRGEQTVVLEICHAHTNITSIRKNGIELFKKEEHIREDGTFGKRELLTLEGIKEFADTIDLQLVKDIIEPQMECNMKIAEEGLKGGYGLGIGKVLKEAYPECITTKIKSYTASASEARMGGCDLPVVINSGSGNQGITSSVPVIVYAKENNIPEEIMYRGLLFSNLLTVYQKSFIGKLSAFCGVVSASCSSAAAITYISGYPMENIKMTIANTLANIPGIICDGAKISCAAKIASSLDAALMAHNLSIRNKVYSPNSGILKNNIKDTISCVGHIGKDGMRQTDYEILKVMLEG